MIGNGCQTRSFGRWLVLAALASFAAALITAGCGGRPAAPSYPRYEPPVRAQIAKMRHAIQVGAFSQLENAVRLSEKLQKLGLEAYYFADEDGLFKVRFGDYRRKEDALARAEALAAAGAIDVYYIVGPDQHTVSGSRRYGNDQLRIRLVHTARRYIGLPYRWGGESPEEGFDCSGLTMTVYRVNGLNLPRNSRQQYRAGTPIERHRLRPGDLVFFDTTGRGVSHVGIYTGGDSFIHAPKSGRTIQPESLSNGYFGSRFVGARTYLQ